MNRLILVRHGGSTANEDTSFYAYNDSAICLTTNGIRQALNTAGVLAGVAPGRSSTTRAIGVASIPRPISPPGPACCRRRLRGLQQAVQVMD